MILDNDQDIRVSTFDTDEATLFNAYLNILKDRIRKDAESDPFFTPSWKDILHVTNNISMADIREEYTIYREGQGYRKDQIPHPNTLTAKFRSMGYTMRYGRHNLRFIKTDEPNFATSFERCLNTFALDENKEAFAFINRKMTRNQWLDVVNMDLGPELRA